MDNGQQSIRFGLKFIKSFLEDHFEENKINIIFKVGALERQVKYIIEFYLGENTQTKDNFIYLTEEEMDDFIYNATKIIDQLLRELLMKRTPGKY